MAIRTTLRNLFSMLWHGADGLRKILHLFVMLFLFAIILSALSSTAPSLPGKAALIIAPVGGLVEQLDGDPYDRAIQELVGESNPQTLVQNIVDGLRFAKEDDRIKVVVLELDGMGGAGLSKLERVAAAIDDFRESGKAVIANASFYSQGAYYLASHASEVYMHPDGLFLPGGFGMYVNYYKNALDKLKVDWNVFRVGTHKSAVEPFMRTDMSEEDRSSRMRLIDQLWGKYRSDIVAARELEAGAMADFSENLLSHLKDNDGDFAQVARTLGFVDDLLTSVELQSIIAEYAGNDDDSERGYPSTDLDTYVEQMRLFDGSNTGEQNVAIIVAAGEILNGSQSPGTIGGESTAKLLRQARRDDSVHAVVLRVDSPGGSSFASEQIRNEIEALRAAGKPVVASMSSVAASGGYWISMAADKIYARETTITGSIGIFGMFPTFQRTLETLGITTDGVGSTPWAGQFRPDREMSEDAKQLIQTVINHGYDDFISKVADHRNMQKEAVDTIAQGQVWTGRDALELGLIDGIGGLDFSIAMAAELAELDDDYGTTYIEQTLSPTEQLVLDLMSSARWAGVDLARIRIRGSAVERLATRLEGAVSPLMHFNDPRGMYAYCFCTLE